ncbi:resolvase [Salmonella enterica subsp. enterica serovar Agona]|nr:resolvase [Salmonella enterica subsp. enterica serovar Agona]
MVHTSIEHRRFSCRGVLILSYQEPTAQQPSNRVFWCSRLLKMTAGQGTATKSTKRPFSD